VIGELMSYDNERFLQCAYYTILGRKPDDEGLCVYLKLLREGASKAKIMNILAKSPEGKSIGVSSVAFEVLLTIYRMMDWPVLLVHLLVRREVGPLRERIRGTRAGLAAPPLRAPLELATVSFGAALGRQAGQLRMRAAGSLPSHFDQSTSGAT